MPDRPRVRSRTPQPAQNAPGSRLRELEVTVESLADLVVVMDEHRCVVECNGASERVWGLKRQDVIGQPMPTSSGRLRLVDREGLDTAPECAPTIRALETGRRQRAPVVGIRRPDGTLTWAQVVAVPVSQPGGSTRIVSVWTDVSSAVEHETQLARMNHDLERRVDERTSALEATIAELEAFSYSVSHDLRSPVRTISVLAESLRTEIDSAGRAHAHDLVDRIHRAAARMDGLIETLLELSTTARAEPRRTRIDISSIARDEIQRLGDRYPERVIECVVPEGIEGFGDEQLVAIALHNLLSNAWKFAAHADAPRVELGVRDPADAADAAGERAYFVRDNGIGFDVEHADELFIPFRRLHSAQPFEGTGVGLAIVHRIITRHGGRVWAESSPGRGATFLFTLPHEHTQTA